MIKYIALMVNFLTLFVFGTGSFFMLKNDNIEPKLRANITTVMAGLLFSYSVMFLLTFFYGLTNKNHILMISLIFAIMPFIIGKFVQYKTLKLYSVLQFLSILISLVYLMMVF